MDLWCPFATKDELGSGDFASADAVWRGVLHTTEGGSYAGARSAYGTVKNPHFTVSFEAGRFQSWQHAPLNRSAKALKNAPGGVETNRWHAVQIEIVGTSDKSQRKSMLYVEDFPQAYLDGIAKLMRWIEKQTGIAPTSPTFAAYPGSAGAHNGVRFDDAHWLSFNGWCGHQHVPENDHGDPGLIPIGALLPHAPTLPGVRRTQDGRRWLGLQNPPLRGQDVVNVRHALHLCDPSFPEGDTYDELTAKTVGVFQAHRGITERGVGDVTWLALGNVPGVH